jgi:hypothetical protein
MQVEAAGISGQCAHHLHHRGRDRCVRHSVGGTSRAAVFIASLRNEVAMTLSSLLSQGEIATTLSSPLPQGEVASAAAGEGHFRRNESNRIVGRKELPTSSKRTATRVVLPGEVSIQSQGDQM